MGAGKTSVGRSLAQHLHWAFEDLDDRIIANEGRSISEIFRDSGEAAFRELEHAALLAVLEELGAGMAKVVALGGGAFAQKKNTAALRKLNMPIIFLDADAEELWQRCSRQAADGGLERPLLQDRKQFQKLYASRRTAYRQASFKIRTSGREIDEIAGQIIKSLGLRTLAIRNQEGEVE